MDKKEKEGGKGKSIAIIIIIIITVLIIIILSAILTLFYNPFSSLVKEDFNVSKEISSVFLSNDLNFLYIKLDNKNITSILNSSKVKLVLENLNGTIFYYETNKTLSEIKSNEISIPKRRSIFDFFIKNTDYIYDIKMTLSDVNGLNSFNDITDIKVIFIINESIAINATSQNTTTNVTKPKKKTPQPSSSSDSTTTTVNCTVSAWQNDIYRCSSGIREVKQYRDICPSGTEERWTTSECNTGYVCYSDTLAPSDKCINETLYCIDSDNGINTTVNGFLNISNNIYNDSCFQNKTLVEYYCYFNGTEFIANNQTSNCTFSCLNGACIVCTDIDNDGYSPDGGDCGEIDCNDTNPDINPGKQEICGNSLDENCDNITSCINLQQSLIAYYKLNDSLDDNLATDETGYYNASCTNCPFYNQTFGLNNSGSYEFNGVSNSLVIPSMILNNNTYSLSLWINPKTSSSDGMIIYSNAGSITNGFLSLWFDGNRNSLNIYNNYGLDYQTPIDSIAPNEWTNVIFIYDYTNIQAKLYINGILKTTITNFQKTPEPSLALIGAKIDQKYFKGNMAELRVYNRTLSNDEISYLSNEFTQTLPSLSLFNIEIDNTMIFYGIVLLIILVIIFLIFYILSRIYKKE